MCVGRKELIMYLFFETSLHFLEDVSVVFFVWVEDLEPRISGLKNGPALQQLQSHAIACDPGDLGKGFVGCFDRAWRYLHH